MKLDKIWIYLLTLYSIVETETNNIPMDAYQENTLDEREIHILTH